MPYREHEPLPEVDRSVLVVGLNGKVIGLSRHTGAERWLNSLPGGGTGEVFLALRYGALVVSAEGGKVYRLDYATGKTLWSQPTTAAGRATILIEADSIVVAKGGYLDCYDHDGARLWSQPLKGLGLGRVALGFPGNLAQADDIGNQ